MRHTSGWIKLHRTLTEGDIAQNSNRLTLFIHIITRANYKPSKIEWRGKSHILKRSQMLTGIADLSLMCKISAASVKRQLDYLIDSGALERQTSKSGTIITVCNYDRYQSENDFEETKRNDSEPDRDIDCEPVCDVESEPVSAVHSEELRTNKKELRINTSHSANEDENCLELVSPEIMPQETKKKASKKKRKTKAVSKTITKSDGTFVWEAYSSAYDKQYGHLPIRNAKVNALCSQLVKRIGKSAPEVAAFYVSHRASWYVQKLHMLEYCVKDAEKLYTEFQAGIQMTNQQAKQCDFKQSLDEAGDAYMRSIEEMGIDIS